MNNQTEVYKMIYISYFFLNNTLANTQNLIKMRTFQLKNENILM